MKKKIELVLIFLVRVLTCITDLVVGVRLLSKCKLYFYKKKTYHKKIVAIFNQYPFSLNKDRNFCVYIFIFEGMILISHEGTFKFENEGSLNKSYPCMIQPSWDIKEINQ